MECEEDRTKSATKVTLVGSAVNVFLALFKFVVGMIGGSSAMIADSVHSLSDLLTDITVIVGFRMVKKPEDETHDWGHGKFETLSTVIIGMFLFAVAVGIVVSGSLQIYKALEGETIPTPGWIALSGAVVSIIFKEITYHYTIRVGNRIKSNAIIANAWHHRSDSLSSLAALLGIGGAILLGGKWAILDPIAAIIVSFLIFMVSFKISKEGLYELTEASLDKKTEKKIKDIIDSTPGVRESHALKTRKIGPCIAVEVNIHVNMDIGIVKAHDISTEVEKNLKKEFGKDSYISIHVEPDGH